MANRTLESYPKLLSLAAHEFRTPISVVGGYLRMLQRDTDSALSDRQRKMVDEAEKSCARIVALIAELSDIGKLDAGGLTLSRQSVDLWALTSEVAEHVHEARDRDVRFEVRGGSDRAMVTGDPTRLRTAFDAVFRSILREKAGPATVVAERRREPIDGRSSAVIVVAEDTAVQDAYERARGAFDEGRGGLGLALPLARRIFESYGGGLFAPVAVPPGSTDDLVARGSAIITIPLTE
jgi:signal transduction histidine kinase